MDNKKMLNDKKYVKAFTEEMHEYSELIFGINLKKEIR